MQTKSIKHKIEQVVSLTISQASAREIDQVTWQATQRATERIPFLVSAEVTREAINNAE